MYLPPEIWDLIEYFRFKEFDEAKRFLEKNLRFPIVETRTPGYLVGHFYSRIILRGCPKKEGYMELAFGCRVHLRSTMFAFVQFTKCTRSSTDLMEDLRIPCYYHEISYR